MVTQQLFGVAAVVAWLATVLLIALAVRRRWPQQKEWSRKVVHIGTGAVVLLAWAFAIPRGLALSAAALVTVGTALNHRFRLLPAVEDVGRHSYGTIAYGASITILLALYWPQQPLPVAAGVLVMACGDGLAGLIGPQLNSPRWQLFGQTKSVAGTGAMALTSWLVLALMIGVAQATGTPAPSMGAAAAIALTATGLEQLSGFGIDNLSVPLSTAYLWQLAMP
ncbi:dolichol kinase [Synechococcus sp. A10-1-5-1]|uniref:diacylglycerol/polyprenol kinase family protein n=1 Tax=Synechococcus sp. A10-1-5-1 TaxID=2936507 RepID=UPI002001C017|nr:dolichol kinase [Synechococcus sp. A10-1-5-1]UPM51514.1 dolichol kinase [Synechococcus sp. A10-1-5-1]